MSRKVLSIQAFWQGKQKKAMASRIGDFCPWGHRGEIAATEDTFRLVQLKPWQGLMFGSALLRLWEMSIISELTRHCQPQKRQVRQLQSSIFGESA